MSTVETDDDYAIANSVIEWIVITIVVICGVALFSAGCYEIYSVVADTVVKGR